MRERAFPMTAVRAAGRPPAARPPAGQFAKGQPATTGEADWRELSACRQEDPELFFPVVPAGPGLAQIEQAKAVCARCKVRAECLRFAMETVQDHGVWGGTSEEERRSLRRARNRQAAMQGPARATRTAPGCPPGRAASRQR